MKPNQEYDIDDLLAKYFSGNASPEEALFVDEWKNTNNDNLKQFNQTATYFGVTLKQANATHLYKQIAKQIHAKPTRVIKLNLTKRWVSAAAVLFFVSLGVLLLVKRNSKTVDEILTAQNITEKVMTDGSKITLNKKAQLTIVGDYNNKQRRLKLTGEAFFEVQHQQDKPFVVEAGDLIITDIGTAFNVNALPASDTVLVYVTQGVVDVAYNDATIRLTKDESAVYIKSTHEFKKEIKILSNINAYKTKQFSFKSATLNEVIAAINNVYGQTLVLSNKELGKCLITVDFNNELPATIAIIVAETLGLNYTEQNGTYVLSGNTCVQ